MKLSNYKFDIKSPIQFQGDFNMQSLNVFCGTNGSGKTLVNKINYFGSYIHASIPEMLKVQVYQMLTHVDDGTLDLVTETSFIENFQKQLDELDSTFINNIFNGVILPDLFEENNLTGTLTYIYENDKSYREPLNQIEAKIAQISIPEVPEGMELSKEDELVMVNTQAQIQELEQTKAQIVDMVDVLDFINGITITITVDNNIFQGITFEADVQEFEEGADNMHFMEQKIASIMLIGENAYPTYMTGSCRNFQNFDTFMKMVPKAKQETQLNCQEKTQDFEALMHHWREIYKEKVAIPDDESQQAAMHIKERMNVVEYFFSQSIDFWHKKEFLELCVQAGYSIMDTEVFLKLEKFKESIAEHGFNATNPQAAEMLEKMGEMIKIEDIIVEQDTLCVVQDGKRKSCSSLSAGEQSIVIMFMVPFYKL